MLTMGNTPNKGNRLFMLLALTLIAWTANPQAVGAADDGVVARIGDWKLTQSELDKSLAGRIYEIDQQIYQLRLQKIQELMAEHMMNQEAKQRGITLDKLRGEIGGKQEPVSDKMVTEFIEKNHERLPNQGKGMEDRIRGFLENRAGEQAASRYLADLAKKFGAQITLAQPKAPRIPIKGPEDLAKGPARAPITIVEFSDFQCPYCRNIQATLNKLFEQYPDKVRLVFRHYPLPIHPLAAKAAEASQCAADQGGFWAYHDTLFTTESDLELPLLKELAAKQKLDTTKFNECLTSGKHAARIQEDMQEGENLGVNGTPAFFINGIPLVGARPLSEYKRIIDDELAKK
ncbi:MAG: thioredoxin domain-containing protein [Magnetococcales bacterium]|nr:thioredoxin domain-containing protein [Magnetococcales bacterium]MBF0322314.1 thioredoxin domain-containing protein [Magnetococcales bacterium]